MNEMAQIKNINNTMRDMQKQVSQLKAQLKTFNTKNRGEYVLKCDANSIEFKQYDLCKVAGSQVEKFDGTEDYESDLLPGIVLAGNFGDSDGDVLVLVNGTGYVKVSEDVTAGQLLYPDSADYTKGKLSGNVGFWKALADADADNLVKVTIIYGTGGGGGEVFSYPCKIVSGAGTMYKVDVHANGKDKPATSSNEDLQILQLAHSEALASGTWVIGFRTNVEVLNDTAI